MRAQLRFLPSTPSAASTAARMRPRGVRRRQLCTACACRAASVQAGAGPLVGHPQRTTSRTVSPAVFVAGQRRPSSVAAAAIEESPLQSGSPWPGDSGHDEMPAADEVEDIGPIQEYYRRVASGLLRNDEHQRGS